MHHAAAHVEPETLKQGLKKHGEKMPEFKNYGVPNFAYSKTVFNSKPKKEEKEFLAQNSEILDWMEEVGSGKRFSQKNLEMGWDLAFKEAFCKGYKSVNRRAPRAEFIAGVRFTACRALRVMHSHYKKSDVGNAETAEDCDDDLAIDDETLATHFQNHLLALDGCDKELLSTNY